MRQKLGNKVCTMAGGCTTHAWNIKSFLCPGAEGVNNEMAKLKRKKTLKEEGM